PHEFRIAEKSRAVGVGHFHRLDHEMRALDRGGTENGKIVALKDIKYLDEVNAARRRWRHRENLVAAIVARNRRSLDRLIARQVLARHRPARRAHAGCDLSRDPPLIESARPPLGYLLQRIGKVALHEE